MHPANCGTTCFHSGEDARIQSAAGMQDNLAAQLFGPDASEFACDFCGCVIGHRNQKDVRRKDLPRHSRAWLSGTDESNGAASARFAARNNRDDRPSFFAQAAAQRAPDAACTDDGQGVHHNVLA
jgi:hypothetical protein